jgi:autotransporter-associated beta strand protein
MRRRNLESSSNIKRSRTLLAAAAVPVVLAMGAGSVAHGSSYYMDTNAATSGFGGSIGATNINWNGATSGTNYWTTDSSGASATVVWVNSVSTPNDAILDQDPSLGTSTTTNILVNGSANANSLQFTTGENYTFVNSTAAGTLTLGTGSANGGISVNHNATYVFDSSLSAATQVVISADNAGAVVNFGDKNGEHVVNTFTGGLAITSTMRVNIDSSRADGANGVVNGNTITVTGEDCRVTTLSGLDNAEYDVFSQLNINPNNVNPYDPATRPYGFYTSVGATTFKATASTGYLVWKGQLTSPQPTMAKPFNPDITNTDPGFTHPTGVVLGNDTFLKGGGNAITVFANSTNNYTGETVIGSTGGAINNGVVVGNGAGSLRLGANNALPAMTDLVVGLPNVAKVWGNFDMGGYSTSVNSIQTPFANFPGSVGLGITNSHSLGTPYSSMTTSTLTITGQLDTGATIHQFDSPIGAAAANLATLNGTSQNASDDIAIVYNSPATLQLGAANTYTGGTTIHQGTIQLADTSLAFTNGSLSPNGALTFTGAGTLDLMGRNQQVTGFSSTGAFGTVTNNSGASTFTVNVTGTNTNTYSGVITNGSGSIALTKIGTGTLVLTSSGHTYTGNTNVTGGGLIVDGSLPAASNVSVGPTALLGGHGTIGGGVTIQTGAILAPGESQPLTVGSLTVQQGADLRFGLAADGSGDSVNVLGALSFTGANRSAVEITGSTLNTASPYHLFSFGGALTGGTGNLILYPLPAGYSGSLQHNGNNIDLVVTSVTPDIWTGSASNVWNANPGADQNWTQSGSAVGFTTGDQVVFDDSSGTTPTTVSIPSSVAPSSITFNNSARAYTLSGPIGGNSSLVVNGGGQVTLTGTNTFAGVVQINSGTLNVTTDAGLGDSGNLVVMSTPTTQGTLAVANGFISNREFTLHGAANFSVGSVGTDSASITGILDGGGSLVKQGPGELVLSNASNSYNGSTTISAGKLSATATGALPSTTDVSVATGANLNLTASQTVGSVAGAGGVQLGSGVTLTTTGNASTTISGVISGAGTLTKNGSGTLTLSGANTFGGSGQVVTVGGGTLAISADNNLGNSNNSIALASNTTLALNTGSTNTTSSRSIALTGSAGTTATITFNSANLGSTVAPVVVLNGAITGSSSLTIIGPGTTPSVGSLGSLTLGSSSNTFNGLTISNAIVNASSGAALGGGPITLTGATVNLPTSGSTGNSVTIGNFGATLNIPSGSFTLNGLVAGGQNTGITKTGNGTLVLNAAPSVYQGAWNINAGMVQVITTDAAGGGNQSPLGTGGTTGGTIPSNSVIVGAGSTVPATLQLAGIAVGQYFDNKFSPQIYMNGGNLQGTGNASYGYDANPGSAANPGTDDASGGLLIDRNKNATFSTVSATDVLTIQNTVMQYDTTGTGLITGPGNSTITISGPGKVLLNSGTVVQGSSTNNHSSGTYAGSWAVTNGILQVGPVIPDPTPLGSGGGPFGEPLNALGYVNGDPDQPNPVKITGGILALSVDAPNANPNWTANTPANPTPNFIRNGVELAGGAIASTGFEVSYGANKGDPQGIPTSTPVTGQFGGNFQVDAGTSKVLVYDPSASTSPMTVQLVSGVRNLPNGDIINGTPVTSVSYTTTWIGTLQVDPGASSTGGTFSILRNGGTIAVTNGAKLQLLNGSKVVLGGTADALSDGTHFVNVQNDSTQTDAFNVTAGSKNIGVLSGTAGKTTVANGATLTATNFTQNTLTLNGTGMVRKISTAANAGTNASTVTNLVINSGGTLDLTNNEIFANGTASDAEALITSGKVITTDGAGHPSGLTLGYKDQGVPAGQYEIRATLLGDTDLDGQVNVADLANLAGNFGVTSGMFWLNGDFDNNGNVNVADLADLAGNFGASLTSLGFSGNADAAASPAAAAVPAASAVPEPTTLGLFGVAATALLTRRRRRQSR